MIERGSRAQFRIWRPSLVCIKGHLPSMIKAREHNPFQSLESVNLFLILSSLFDTETVCIIIFFVSSVDFVLMHDFFRLLTEYKANH